MLTLMNVPCCPPTPRSAVGSLGNRPETIFSRDEHGEGPGCAQAAAYVIRAGAELSFVSKRTHKPSSRWSTRSIMICARG